MIRHVVAFRLAADSAERRQADAQALKRRLEALVDVVPHVDRLEVGLDLGRVEGHWDAVLVSEHASNAELEAYQSHPEHVAAAADVSRLVTARASVDYEV